MSRRIQRDENEFGRTLSFFDATFALAMTLLVTTLDPGPGAWDSWSALWDAVGFQFVAFVISFTLVAAYWWANHRFVGALESLSPGLILGNVALLGFVVLIPFTADALGNSGRGAVEVATVLYAVNIGIVSTGEVALHAIARRDGLFRRPPTSEQVRVATVQQLVPSVVFFGSVPVAFVVSGDAARLCWISIAVLSPLAGRWAGRRAAAWPDGGPGADPGLEGVAGAEDAAG